MDTNVAYIGHNDPPPESTLDRLRSDHANLIARKDELLGGCERAPSVIEDEETAGKMADFVQKQIDPFLKRALAVHEAEKEPFLSGGRTVDGFWHSLVDDLRKAKDGLNAVRKAYADKKAAEERRRREEEARKAREEQERLAREAREREAAACNEVGLDAAIAAQEAADRARLNADEAARAAAAKPAELGRSRGDYGGLTTLKQFWDFADINRGAIDLEALRGHIPMDALEKAIRSWIKANADALKEGKRLTGARIFENTRL
jgi:hypothetical protein